MKKRFQVGLALAIALVACVFIMPSQAHAAPLSTGITRVHAAAHKATSCPTPISYTTTAAWLQHGSPPPHVSMTVWIGCDGKVYASANSFTASGFTIHGTTTINDANNGSYAWRTCNYGGICDTPEISWISGHYYYGYYAANNLPSTNHFYNCNPSGCNWGTGYFYTFDYIS
jgi:hypothetical protein